MEGQMKIDDVVCGASSIGSQSFFHITSRLSEISIRAAHAIHENLEWKTFGLTAML
jgi:hypothetical protein